MPVLFTLTTGRTRLIWSGPAADVLDDRETVRAVALSGTSCHRLDVAGVVGDVAPLRLVEEAAYSVWLESLDGSPVVLRHADPVLTGALESARGGTIVHGPVRFGSQAGRSRFVVAAGGVPEATVDVTVAPVKASWADVEAMRERVEASVAGVSLAAVRPTDLASAPVAGRAPAPAWLALLRTAGPRLARALASVARDPETTPSRPLVTVRPSALRRASGETVRALRGTAVWPERVPGRPAQPSLDTPAHRWIAAGLDAALARASALRAAEGARPGSLRRTVVVDELDRLRGLLARSRRIEPLREAGAPPPAAAPLSLRLRPAYSEAADALATLHGALRIGEGAVSVSTQDVGALYETWAALETVAAFARAVGAEAPARPFGARAVGTDIYLQRGPRYSVRLVGEHVEVEVVRAPRFEGPPALLVQVPDLLVVVRVPGRPDRRVVLDAKYRLAEGVGRRGTPAPPGDALGALHRYRDAIVGPDGRRGYVDTAVALYPARPGGDYETSRLWTSIEAIGVGGVPLLPGESGWLDRFARRVVSGAG